LRAGALWLMSLLLLPLTGVPIAAHPSCRRLSLAGRFVLSAACGAVVLSWVMNIWALVPGWRWNVPLLIAASLVVCLLLRIGMSLAEPSAPRRLAERFSRGERAGMVLLGLAVCSSFVAAATASATSSDLILFWGPKAQAFAQARTIDAGFLGAPYLEYIHAPYPPLVPDIWAFASIVAGRFPWGAATLTFPLLLALLAIGLSDLLRLAAPRSTAIGTAAFCIAAVSYLGDLLDIAGNGDMPLLFFEVLATALLIGPWALQESGQLVAGLFLAGAVSAKVEGLPFVLTAGTLFLIFRVKARRGASARLFLPPLACLAAWFAFGASRKLFYGYEGYGKIVEIHWERIPLVAAAIGKALFDAGYALPWLLALFFLVLVGGSWRRALVPSGAALVLAAFFFFTYLHGQPDPTLWISWSAGRIFIPIAVLLALGAAARADCPIFDQDDGRPPASSRPEASGS
jgi:hypothetical protein